MPGIEEYIEDITKTGESIEEAIKICANTTDIGVQIEYLYLHQTFGQNAWKLEQQCLSHFQDKSYDIFEIVLQDNVRKRIYFDISNFYGKFPWDL
jgi:hypothetical protein